MFVLDLNGDLQRSGDSLTSVMRQQVENQTTLENIDEAIETLQVDFREEKQLTRRNACVC
jgi:hypothetical protein